MRSTNNNNLSQQVLLVSEKNREFKELADELSIENFSVHHISKLSEAIHFLKKERPKAIVIDSSSNEVACFELCYAIKSNSGLAKSYLIIVSSSFEERTEIEAFKTGADDFVLLPLRILPFVQRLKTRIQEPKEIITVQSEATGASRIKIDRESYSVFVGNDSLDLSRKEFELLYLLASHPGKIFSRHEIFEKVWMRKERQLDRTIDVHILRLRKKLGEDLIFTQKGVGYKFAV